MAASKVNVVIGLSSKQFDDQLKKVQRNLASVGRSMESVGKSMSTYITAPVLAAGAASVKFAADFESSLVKIQNLVGVSESEIAGMMDGIKAVSKETGVSLNSLADSLYNIMGAGLKGAAALDVLAESAKLSAIGMGDAKDIGKTLVATLAAYGQENISAAKASEILMATVREGNTDAAELAPALGRVISIASQMGISFEEVGASIATFTRLGVDSEIAVVGLRSALANIMKPSEQAVEQLGQVGMTFAELRSQIKEKGLANSLIGLMNAFNGDTEALARIIPDIQGLTAVLATAGTQADSYREVLDKITNSTGIVDDAMLNVSETATFKFNAALSELTNSAIEIGSIVMPIFLKIVNAVKSLATSFSSLDPATKEIIISFVAVVAALGPVILVIGKTMTAIAALTAAVRALSMSNALLIGEILLVVAAALALSAGLVYLIKNWQAITERVQNFFRLIDNYLIDALSGLLTVIKDIAQFLGLDILDETIIRLENSKHAAIENSKEFKSLGEIFSGASDKISDLTDSSKLFNDAGAQTAEVINQVKTSTNQLTGSFNELSKASSVLKQLSEFESKGFQKLNEWWIPVKNIEDGNASLLNLIETMQTFKAEAKDVPPVEIKILSNDEDVADRMIRSAESISNSINQSVNAAVAGSAEIIGEMLVMGASFDQIGKTIGIFLLDTLGNLMMQVGESAIAVGLAIEGIKDALMSLNPAVALAAGIALVALGAAVKGYLANTAEEYSSPTAFAEGGIVSGPTNALIGEYAGARRNPEVVAPLDRLTSIITNSLQNIGLIPNQNMDNYMMPSYVPSGRQSGYRDSIQVEVIGKIEGKDIYLSGQRYSRKINRTT